MHITKPQTCLSLRFTDKLYTEIWSPLPLNRSHFSRRMQQPSSSSWPPCMPVWDKNVLTGKRNCKKIHTIELPPLTPPTHKWCCMDTHFIYKLCVNVLDVYCRKYYFQSPVFTARQVHCQPSLHRTTVTPDGFQLNLRPRVLCQKHPGAPCPLSVRQPQLPSPIRTTHQEAELQR